MSTLIGLFVGLLLGAPTTPDSPTTLRLPKPLAQCPTTQIVHPQATPWTVTDQAALDAAHARCVVWDATLPCLVTFTVRGYHDYLAICGAVRETSSSNP